ncbi:ribosome maturation factor RimM [Xanthobacter sp. DSM 24535]|uniref:ribosome maturation factor RimM n=1 Tax=Roseixanthobacter psychrophilus TaxID=3119917 RepID=UPI00372B114B
MTDKILIARIGAPHGVRGEVRLFVFGEDPMALRRYKLSTTAGKRIRIQSLREAKDHFVARLEGVADRTAAEALTNTDLLVARADLPPPEEDAFYHADLIGLSVEDEAGTRLGAVTALHDFGAGDILEYLPEGGGKTRLVPFTKAAVPVVDLAARRVVVVEEAEAEDEPQPEDADLDPDAALDPDAVKEA